jgi:hypothetical protein
MRGDSQVAPARLRSFVPARSWAARLEQVKQRRRQRRDERLEVIVRLQDEQRRARRAGGRVRL